MLIVFLSTSFILGLFPWSVTKKYALIFKTIALFATCSHSFSDCHKANLCKGFIVWIQQQECFPISGVSQSSYSCSASSQGLCYFPCLHNGLPWGCLNTVNSAWYMVVSTFFSVFLLCLKNLIIFFLFSKTCAFVYLVFPPVSSLIIIRKW